MEGLEDGYKLGGERGSGTLFHTESTARVCKGVGIETAWPPGDGVGEAWLSYRLSHPHPVVSIMQVEKGGSQT